MEEKTQTIVKAIPIAVAVIIFSVIGALIVSTVLGASIFDALPTTGSEVNETLTALDNVTAQNFAIISTDADSVCTLTLVSNVTDGSTITAGNYTQPTTCSIVLTDDSTYIGEDVYVDYGYTYDSDTSLAGVDVDTLAGYFGAFVTGLLSFLGIIGIILGVLWLIMYVIKLFGRGGLNDLGSTAS